MATRRLLFLVVEMGRRVVSFPLAKKSSKFRAQEYSMHPATRSQLRIALLVPAILLILTAVLNAQNSNSALRGLVQDASAARVAGAQVVVRLTGTGSSIARE